MQQFSCLYINKIYIKEQVIFSLILVTPQILRIFSLLSLDCKFHYKLSFDITMTQN